MKVDAFESEHYNIIKKIDQSCPRNNVRISSHLFWRMIPVMYGQAQKNSPAVQPDWNEKQTNMWNWKPLF